MGLGTADCQLPIADWRAAQTKNFYRYEAG